MLVHSFAGDDALFAKAYVRRKLGIAASTHRSTFLHQRDRRSASEEERTRIALGIWAAAVDPRDSASEIYLRNRSIPDLSESAYHAIRHHPCCPFAGDRVPCMLGLVRNILTDVAQAIHRTALTQDGRKASIEGKQRLALGPLAGGAIKLTADESVTCCVGVAEGIETALSLQQVPEFGPSPVWALISAAGLASFPVLPGIETIWIAVDHDPTGERAAALVAKRWRSAGREVFLIEPKASGADINDLLRQEWCDA